MGYGPEGAGAVEGDFTLPRPIASSDRLRCELVDQIEGSGVLIFSVEIGGQTVSTSTLGGVAASPPIEIDLADHAGATSMTVNVRHTSSNATGAGSWRGLRIERGS
jgi:hypothetical protein